jgi:hypothetical protein
LVKAPKGVKHSYLPYGDVCFGVSNIRKPIYHMLPLREWGLLPCGSSNALEIGVIGKLDPKESDDHFKQFGLDDSGRAEIPLENGVERFPMGMTIDFSSSEPVFIGENQIPACPILLLYSTSGILCPFHLVYDRQDLTNLQIPRQDLNTSGLARPGMPKMPVSQPPPFNIAAAAPKPVQPTMPQLKPISQPVAPISQPKPQPPPAPDQIDPQIAVRLKAQEEQKEDARFRQAIVDEINTFAREMATFRAEKSGNMFQIATIEERNELKKRVMEAEAFRKKAVNLRKTFDDRLAQLNGDLMTSFAVYEDANQLAFK